MRRAKIYNHILTLKDIIKHIKKCNKREVKYNFLGLVEVNDIDANVENLFKIITPSGYVGYDWINGNNNMMLLIEDIKKGRYNGKTLG